MLYASFGLGSLVAPFIIGSFARTQVDWNLYYWLPFSLVLLTMFCHFFLFKDYVLPSDEGAAHRGTARSRFAQTGRARVTWIGATLTILSFAIFYIVSNWLTTYLLNLKGVQPDASRYHLSVFFAGMVSGRIFFSLPFVHIRDRIGNTLLLGAFCGTSALLWKVNSNTSSWVAVALGGFFLGPNTPGILYIVSTRVSPNLKETVMSIIIGLGLVGAILGPLLFGMAAGKVGLQVFPGVVITLSMISALVYWSVPPREKRD
ncbi:hypothetical protein FRC09_017755 [Ceratobasidium sp. 395]|nr:hypothetical protein FRC09_017755 [Ceratobasidium sp. 395]